MKLEMVVKLHTQVNLTPQGKNPLDRTLYPIGTNGRENKSSGKYLLKLIN
jgi:hypothetical protein